MITVLWIRLHHTAPALRKMIYKIHITFGWFRLISVDFG